MVEGLVSSIIPVHNRPELLREAVDSILAQTYRPIEIIIVDDGSTDNTPAGIEKLADAHEEMRYFRQANQGPGVARETGRKAARGEYIQYLDSDDLLLADKFTSQVNALQQNPDCMVAYGMTRYRHADGKVEPGAWKRSGERIETMFPSFLQSRWWDTPNPLYRSSICQKAGAWTNLRLEEDWEYDCRISSLGVTLAYVPEFVCEVRDHSAHRLCRGSAGDPDRMRQRALAHQLIFKHAMDAGISLETDEMQHFARELFLLSRQCGAAGLENESKTLFDLSIAASLDNKRDNLQFRVYRLSAWLVGWILIGKISIFMPPQENLWVSLHRGTRYMTEFNGKTRALAPHFSHYQKDYCY